MGRDSVASAELSWQQVADQPPVRRATNIQHPPNQWLMKGWMHSEKERMGPRPRLMAMPCLLGCPCLTVTQTILYKLRFSANWKGKNSKTKVWGTSLLKGHALLLWNRDGRSQFQIEMWCTSLVKVIWKWFVILQNYFSSCCQRERERERSRTMFVRHTIISNSIFQ